MHHWVTESRLRNVEKKQPRDNEEPRIITYIKAARRMITSDVSWHAQLGYVCDHTFFVVLAHCA